MAETPFKRPLLVPGDVVRYETGDPCWGPRLNGHIGVIIDSHSDSLHPYDVQWISPMLLSIHKYIDSYQEKDIANGWSEVVLKLVGHIELPPPADEESTT